MQESSRISTTQFQGGFSGNIYFPYGSSCINEFHFSWKIGPGTAQEGVGNVFESFKGLPTDRLSAGAITDLCIDESQKTESVIFGMLEKLL